MAELHVNKAQRKAMGEAADEWQGRVDTTDEYIDRIIAAANSIPEGPPVGTIARRPDGVVLAHKDGDEPFKCPCCKLVFGAGTDRIEVCDLCVASHPITTRDASQTQQEPGEIDCRNCDGRKCMGCVFREHPHDCADDCPECCEPRTPRVVDRLGVDEQGSRWRNRVDTEFWFQDKYWNFRTKDGCTSWFAAGYEPKMCIFTEVFDVG